MMQKTLHLAIQYLKYNFHDPQKHRNSNVA